MAVRKKGQGGAEYSVREVVRATGITEHTLRAWERRHTAIEPERSEGGTRRYSTRDLARLILLKRAVEDGHRISAIASKSDAELEALCSSMAVRHPAEGGGRSGPLWRPAFDAVVRLDAADAEQHLSQQFSALGPVVFGKQVALPLMAAIGDGWHDGDVSPASEHMATAIVRSLLGIAIRSQPRGPGAFTLLTTTFPGERHEAALLVACLIAIEAGLRVVHLGVELPPGEIVQAAAKVGADAVLLGLTAPGDEAGAQLEALSGTLPRTTEIWTGGSSVVWDGDSRKPKHFNNISKLEAHMRSIESV
jgi:DNA-binding transcriptional MerR regulator